MLAEKKAKATTQAQDQGEDAPPATGAIRAEADAGADPQEDRQWPADTIAGRPRHLPPLYELIEGGKVLALNMPAGSNPALARAIGVMAQKRMASSPAHAARPDEGIPKHLLPARCLYLRRVSILRVGRRGRSHRR